MLEDIRDSVLRRKLVPKAVMPAFEFSAPLPEEDAGGRLLPRSFIRAASRVADLVVRASVRTSRSVTLDELVDMPEVEGFTALLNAREGPPGLVILDPVVFSSVIESMTIGGLFLKTPAQRRATNTDAALIGELVDAILSELDTNPDPADPFMPGFGMGPLAEDLRLLDVMLEDVPFALTALDVELLADGVSRRGQFILALPEPVADMPDFTGIDMTFDDAPAHDPQWERALEASVMAAPAQLSAVLGRVTIPLSEALELGVDSRLTLPLSQLEEVQLETVDRKPMALGRLGQCRGMRALRLTVMPDSTAAASPTGAEGGGTEGAGPDIASGAMPGLDWLDDSSDITPD